MKSIDNTVFTHNNIHIILNMEHYDHSFIYNYEKDNFSFSKSTFPNSTKLLCQE